MKEVELWSDEDIDRLSDIVYSDCVGEDCDQCPYRLEVNNETCKADIIQELWRKWRNERTECKAEIIKLRDDLYANDQITMRGLAKMNRFIYGVKE